jgi:hypothetical protein
MPQVISGAQAQLQQRLAHARDRLAALRAIVRDRVRDLTPDEQAEVDALPAQIDDLTQQQVALTQGIGNHREHFWSACRGQGMPDAEIQARRDREHGRG